MAPSWGAKGQSVELVVAAIGVLCGQQTTWDVGHVSKQLQFIPAQMKTNGSSKIAKSGMLSLEAAF
jgi:hypothetical protein